MISWHASHCEPFQKSAISNEALVRRPHMIAHMNTHTHTHTHTHTFVHTHALTHPNTFIISPLQVDLVERNLGSAVHKLGKLAVCDGTNNAVDSLIKQATSSKHLSDMSPLWHPWL